ncbi:MAG: hypothetical protein CMJ83_03600 [Planctomycetes bacterium]|nr:hypothetical protein [Planctomycetota bacterium]
MNHEEVAAILAMDDPDRTFDGDALRDHFDAHPQLAGEHRDVRALLERPAIGPVPRFERPPPRWYRAAAIAGIVGALIGLSHVLGLWDRSAPRPTPAPQILVDAPYPPSAKPAHIPVETETLSHYPDGVRRVTVTTTVETSMPRIRLSSQR